MHPITLRQTRFSRRLALLAGALLHRPRVVRAHNEQMAVFVLVAKEGAGYSPYTFTLQLTIAPDGSSGRVQGGIHRDGDIPRTLIAQDAPAQVRFADADGDGTPGPIGFATTCVDAASGEQVPFDFATLEGQDIDADGEYAVDLRVGGERVRLLVDVTINVTPLPDPDRRRRKRKRHKGHRKHRHKR